MWYILLLLTLSWCSNVNGESSESGVFLRFKGQIVPNNSYILYNRIRDQSQYRLYCYTDNIDCCNEHNSDWYLPNGERILGGFEYEDITVGVFAKSTGFRLVGLYRHHNPHQRGRFWCVLPDSNGNNRTLFANIVDEIPVIDIQPLSQTVVKGETVTFSIRVSNSNFAFYKWQKDDMDLKDSPGRYEGTITTALTIINAQEEKEGNYHCVIDNFLVSDASELSVGKLAL